MSVQVQHIPHQNATTASVVMQQPGSMHILLVGGLTKRQQIAASLLPTLMPQIACWGMADMKDDDEYGRVIAYALKYADMLLAATEGTQDGGS